MRHKFALIALAAASLICAPAIAEKAERQAYTGNIADDKLIVLIQRVAYRPYDVHLAVVRTGPDGITSLQAPSVVDLAAKSRFKNFADRYRAIKHNMSLSAAGELFAT